MLREAVNIGRSGVKAWRRWKVLDLVLGACFGLLAWRGHMLDGDTGTMLQVAGGLGIGLLAFVVTPVSTLLALDPGGARFQAFDRIHRKTILAAMAWAFTLSLLLLLATLAGSVMVDPDHADGLKILVVGLGTASTLAGGRLFWFFFRAIGLRHLDQDAPLLEDLQR